MCTDTVTAINVFSTLKEGKKKNIVEISIRKSINLNIRISLYREFKNEMTYKPSKYLIKKKLDQKLTSWDNFWAW